MRMSPRRLVSMQNEAKAVMQHVLHRSKKALKTEIFLKSKRAISAPKATKKPHEYWKTSNHAAFYLAEKMGFEPMRRLPDLLP